jgi:hypothetical protein
MKPAVYTQLYVQIVFAVENRQCLLRNKEYNEQIFKYISGTINHLNNKSIITMELKTLFIFFMTAPYTKYLPF